MAIMGTKNDTIYLSCLKERTENEFASLAACIREERSQLVCGPLCDVNELDEIRKDGIHCLIERCMAGVSLQCVEELNYTHVVCGTVANAPWFLALMSVDRREDKRVMIVHTIICPGNKEFTSFRDGLGYLFVRELITHILEPACYEYTLVIHCPSARPDSRSKEEEEENGEQGMAIEEVVEAVPFLRRVWTDGCVARLREVDYSSNACDNDESVTAGGDADNHSDIWRLDIRAQSLAFPVLAHPLHKCVFVVDLLSDTADLTKLRGAIAPALCDHQVSVGGNSSAMDKPSSPSSSWCRVQQILCAFAGKSRAFYEDQLVQFQAALTLGAEEHANVRRIHRTNLSKLTHLLTAQSRAQARARGGAPTEGPNRVVEAAVKSRGRSTCTGVGKKKDGEKQKDIYSELSRVLMMQEDEILTRIAAVQAAIGFLKEVLSPAPVAAALPTDADAPRGTSAGVNRDDHGSSAGQSHPALASRVTTAEMQTTTTTRTTRPAAKKSRADKKVKNTQRSAEPATADPHISCSSNGKDSSSKEVSNKYAAKSTKSKLRTPYVTANGKQELLSDGEKDEQQIEEDGKKETKRPPPTKARLAVKPKKDGAAVLKREEEAVGLRGTLSTPSSFESTVALGGIDPNAPGSAMALILSQGLSVRVNRKLQRRKHYS